MSILIGADIVPTKSNFQLFEIACVENLVDVSLKNILDAADYRIFNLEVPFSDEEFPIDKCGPNLIAPIKTTKGVRAIGADLLTLANNHIMDQGKEGLESTIKALEDNNISYVGAGKTVEDAKKPFVFNYNSKKIGVYACAENEFTIVTDKFPGANPFDPLKSLSHIEQVKKECDYVIVLYHGGKEHYRYPSPNLQKVCRSIVDSGADIVVCQHSHCIGCEEKYNNGTIVYGQGNFLFDYSVSEFWQTGILIQIKDDFEISYIPIEKNGNAVKLASDINGEKILNEFKIRSQEIQCPDVIVGKYEEFANSMIVNYLLAFLGVNKRSIFWRLLNRVTGYRWEKIYLKFKYDKNRLLMLQNFIECEAHRELVIEGLKRKHNKN